MATPADRPQTQLIGTLGARPYDPRLAGILGVSALLPVGAGLLWTFSQSESLIPIFLLVAGIAQGALAVAVGREYRNRVLVWIDGEMIHARKSKDGTLVLEEPLAAYTMVDIHLGTGLRRGWDVVLVHPDPAKRVVMGGGPHFLVGDVRGAAKVASEHLGLPLTDDAAGLEKQ